MIIRKLDTDNKSDLEFFEKLYIESFPQNERRSVAKMHALIDSNHIFEVYLLIKEDNFRVGFFTKWTFDKFIFLEHFAIIPESRNQGLGKMALEIIISQIKKPIVGEIELPTSSDMANRRSRFYSRHGFNIWDIPYKQPPYETGFDPIPMLLISYGEIDLKKSVKDIVETIYSNVYQCEIV